MYKWASGRSLQTALKGRTWLPGDFVRRWAKQVIDLLDQLVKVPNIDSQLAARGRQAIGQVRRGVVAYAAVAE